MPGRLAGRTESGIQKEVFQALQKFRMDKNATFNIPSLNGNCESPLFFAASTIHHETREMQPLLVQYSIE
jgi:hypothetical protein